MFNQAKKILQDNIKKLLKDYNKLFFTDIDKDELWQTYLNSFPEGTNPMFRERREFDCNCCKNFIRSFGRVVVINKYNELISIWDTKIEDPVFKPVFAELSKLVKSKPIKDAFITKETKFGTDKNYELKDNLKVNTWEHFYVEIPKQFVSNSYNSVAESMGEIRDIRNVFKRSLEEISGDSIETVLDLTSQGSLYKGAEWVAVLRNFLTIQNEYNNLTDEQKDNYCWVKSIEVGPVIGKIKNHSIGTLLINISEGMELNEAVKKYEAIVAPSNYKRPKAIFTNKMIEQAQQTLSELGLIDSLGRRHAVIDDITVNNILFANRDTLKQMTGNNIFDELKTATSSPKKFNKVEEVLIEEFIEEILPRTTNIEVFLENKHAPNLVSLIGPKIKETPTLFKWNNNFSWTYSGNISDSMKERVKAAGGNVTGVLRFSIQWNEDSDNQNDYDAHCYEPNKNHIWFQNQRMKHPSTGILDVDIVHPDKNQVAVENITWSDLHKIPDGIFKFDVHCYNHRGGRSGFRAEIEYGGQIYSFNYNKDIRYNETITVAKIHFDKINGLRFIESLDSTTSSKTIWNLQTNQFHPVSIVMYSPNYWDLQSGIGNKHYMFMLKKCINDEQPNGFLNEYLKEELLKHKRVFEALGSKMRVQNSNDQLSGVGFSSTQRNELICKIEGHITRTIKLIF